MSDDNSAEYGMVMPFFIDTDGYTDRDREMFACGVEWQMVYKEMKSSLPVHRTIHTENASRVRMMAGRLGRQVTIVPAGAEYPGWSYLDSENPQ